MCQDVLFKEWSAKDLDEAVLLYIAVFTNEPWNDQLSHTQIQQYFQRLLAMNTFAGFTVRHQLTKELIGVSVGFIRPWYQGVEYHLDSFYMAKSFEGQGIGSKFLDYIKEQLSKKEVPDIILDTDKGVPAESFYRKNGFHSDDLSVTLFSSTTKVNIK